MRIKENRMQKKNNHKQAKTGRLIFITLFILPLSIGIALLAFRMYSQGIIRDDSRITSDSGIESLEKITLGSIEQWILIRAIDQSKPVLLWLHGGPGTPTLPLASQHDSELEKHFIVVHWDQRGAGKSFSPDIRANEMTTDLFVADTLELTQLLIERFGKEKIYLIGHSWGSRIGILAVKNHPEKYHAFIGIGQSVNVIEGQMVGYQFVLNLAQTTNDLEALSDLERIGPPPWSTNEERSTYGRLINAFGGTGRQFAIQDYYRELINSPDYDLKDVIGFFRGQQFSATSVVKNEKDNPVNLFEDAPALDLPLFFFQGRFDYNTPGEIVERYVEAVDAPSKSIVWFEDSAHFPQWEEPEKFINELLKILLLIE